MAKGESLLVNDNKITKDTSIIDTFIDPHIFNNKILTSKEILLKDADYIQIGTIYNYRPDRLAYEKYGHDFYYPIILVANNIGSILQFKAETLNFKCYIPTEKAIYNLLGKVNNTFTAQKLVKELFKDIKF